MFAPEENSNKVPEVGEFKSISIPMVRRIYPQLIASDIVSIQPMTAPTGLVNYIRTQYGKNEVWEKPKPKKYGRSIEEPFEPSCET